MYGIEIEFSKEYKKKKRIISITSINIEINKIIMIF